MEIKYTTNFLQKVESIFKSNEYVIRYEKGHFNSGYCILNDKKVIVVNKFFNVEAKINCLIDILQEIEITISPNPIRAGYYFETLVKGLEDGPVYLKIYSEQMKFIKSLNSHSINGVVSLKEKINTSGVYILEIIQEKASKSSKIIVIN